MKIPSVGTFVKRHGFDGVVSTFTPLVLAPIALTGMLSSTPTYPIAMWVYTTHPLPFLLLFLYYSLSLQVYVQLD